MAQAAGLLGVSVDTVRRWADAGRFATRQEAGGHRVVEGPALASFAVRLAEDEPQLPGVTVIGRSARNSFQGIVTRVRRGDVAAQVDIQAGPHRLVSLLTREAVDELGLAEGMLAVATVKATNVGVEVVAP
jgi:molybdopterin-binding protein